ncbi:hypothetical protein N7492_007751 [Penicillium capsulatum]|uniref:Mediator of RNA polymerase II transcription subunit 12 n=1 Tax=Penicillium capsulatum TaxID=69766 RepID=A0A9W9I0H3_9EURO|nr:hypothetical protein N7492_007751 [Penicillium capsulatum]
MIPHSSAGGQPWGHPMRAFNGGPGRFDLAQMHGQYDPPSNSSQPPLPPQARPPVVVDLTAASEPQDREPPPKRPRLDVSGVSSANNIGPAGNSGEARSTPGSAGTRPALSWRGRPAWSFEAVMSELPGSENRGDHATGSKPSSPPPLPSHPWTGVPSDRLQAIGSRSRESSPDKTVQTTPYRIETPDMAPVLQGEKVADFTPWTGTHPEDVLNEQTAKQGYYDRTQVSQNESNTARPALYGQLKHRTGLQLLSSVFSAALEKRQNHNTIHAPSTFKPPPRVTLTDNKREIWLRDLANPSVPLRKLSRTIPHGIRGKVLLDQCLGKWIPVARAVWLAKCVGANEIRAFKRKGTSGALAVGLEAKWVRDWTASVQQFVESVFSAPKSPNWKDKMTYAVGLTARLFFENLLDHDHFLAWFLSSFEAASLATVPIWLLMLGIYWKSIMRYRRRGRRLAEVLLEKLRQATEAKLDILQPLIDRLSRFVKRLVHDHTSSMILPNSWDKYKTQVASCLDLAHKVDRALFQSIIHRNARVQKPRNSKQTTQRSPHQRIIHLLDSIRSAHDITAISNSCLDAVEDRVVLVSKLLEWLATPFRHGICRVYVGVRLLRRWKSSGVDIDDHVLAFFSRCGNINNLNMDNVYHAISELVRSQTFSVGRYLQWLMAKGVISVSSGEKQSVLDLPGDIGLIAQLPVGRLPEHVGNLRSTLLARVGFSVQDESLMITDVKELIKQRLPAVFDVNMHLESRLHSLPVSLTWAVKAEVGQWLRSIVAGHTREITTSTLRGTLLGDMAPPTSALTADEFYYIRDILETFGDISMLADVLKCASSSDNSTVLASVADTTNCHFDSLCVIGATSDLFRKLVDSYAAIKRFNMPSLDLMFSLIELGLRIPSELNTVTILRQDLSRIENKTMLAASSPVSDHIPDMFGDMDSNFRENLDQILLSGNVMDEPTLDTIFKTLTKHLETNDGKASLPTNDTCWYLAQLRSFQPKHFDATLVRWVCSLLKCPDRTTLLRILPPLVGVGCVTIRSFLCLVKKLGSSPSAIANLSDLPADLLGLLVPIVDKSKPQDLVSYRFRVAQQEFLAKNCDEILGIICNAAVSLDSLEPKSLARRVEVEDWMVTLLHELLVRNPDCTEKNCMQKLVNQYPATLGALQKALDLLLGVEIEKVIFHDEAGNEDRSNIGEAMFKTVVADSHVQKLHWVDLVALMSPEAVRQIRERAEKEFLSVPLFDDQGNDSSPALQSLESIKSAKLYLTIVEELASSIPDSGTPSIVPVLVEKMETLLHKVIVMQSRPNTSENHPEGVTDQSRSNFERSLAFWFSALLRMVVIHRSSFLQSNPALKLASSQEQSRLLVSIFCIALSRSPGNLSRSFPGVEYFPGSVNSEDCQPCPGILLQTHALDVTASLIDVFPDEIRHHCSRFLREKCPPFVPLQNDPRFLYLLGPMSDVYAPTLAQSTSAPSPAASGSTPTPTASTPAVGPSSQPSALPMGHPVGMTEDGNSMVSRLRLQQRGRIIGPYPLRPWELLEDAAPFVGVNDTAVNLGYFDARRARA